MSQDELNDLFNDLAVIQKVRNELDDAPIPYTLTAKGLEAVKGAN